MAAADNGRQKPSIIFLMGPTASGKTGLAAALLNAFPAEIVSVDSALVYRGMDIGSAKPDGALLARAPHHLIDIRDPAEPYSAADFLADVKPLLAEIVGRGRTPLLVGGTMLYFKVMLEGLAAMPPADPALRADILAAAEARGWPDLHRELAEVDPETAADLHPHHSQRIQRALEIHRLTGKPASQLKREQASAPDALAPLTCNYHIVQIALLPRDRALLHRRIAERFDAMLEQGLIDEVKALFQRGDLTRDMPSMRAVGYRQVWEYLEGRCGYGEMRERALAASRQLAKRQLTWLRKWPDCQAIFIDDGEGHGYAEEELLARGLKILAATPIYKPRLG